MYRDTLEATRGEAQLDEEAQETGADPALTRRLLSAVETYKASCVAAGEVPTVEDSWLVLLSALRQDDDR